MPLAISQDNSVATVKPRGKSPYGTRAGGICPQIGTPYGSQRVFLIIVLPDMMARTHTQRGRRKEETDWTPPQKKGSGRRKALDLLTRRASPDESVTVTFTKNMQSVWPARADWRPQQRPALRHSDAALRLKMRFQRDSPVLFVCGWCACLNHAHFQDFLHVYFKTIEYSVWIKY